MRVDGSCHCGRITYRAEIDPGRVRICHCSDCQTFSSSAFRLVVSANDGSFELLSGEPRIYVKTAESGAKRAQAFCADCSTPIYATSADDDDSPKSYGLRVGAIRQAAALRPSAQHWRRSAVPWLDDLSSMRRAETQ